MGHRTSDEAFPRTFLSAVIQQERREKHNPSRGAHKPTQATFPAVGGTAAVSSAFGLCFAISRPVNVLVGKGILSKVTSSGCLSFFLSSYVQNDHLE